MLFTTKEFEEAKGYWLEKLSGELNDITLIRDFQGSKSYEAADYHVIFTDRLCRGLLKIGKNNDLSLYIILLTSFKILLYKYTGQQDIIVSSPIYGTDSREYNKWVALRDFLYPQMTFKELLLEVKQTVTAAYKNQHYPIRRLIDFLGIREKASLFKTILLLENIHEKEFINDIKNDYENDIAFAILKTGERLEGNIVYNSSVFSKESMEKLADCYFHLLEQVLNDTNIKIADIELVSEKEKKRIRFEFNNTAYPGFPKNKTLIGLFQEQVEKTPDNIAVSAGIDLSDIYEQLKSEKINPDLFAKIETCCFKKNPFIYESDLDLPGENLHFKILKTHRHNSVVTNTNLLKLLDLFDGKRNAGSIFSRLKHLDLYFPVYSIGSEDVMEIANRFSKQEEFVLKGEFEDFVHALKSLYENHLIQLQGIDPGGSGFTGSLEGYFHEGEMPGELVEPDDILIQRRKLSEAHILLLGDTPGMATTGLLYMASYLRRNGIRAYAQFNDVNIRYESLKTNVEELLKEINPKVVAVSMKWFLHIARVLEICKMVKEYSPGIKVVVGGNTAAYYPEEVIRCQWIDYVILGDGERPLLEICRGSDSIPNCVYRQDGEIVRTPVTYVQDKENSSEIYLSHLDEVLISPHSSIFGTFFIYTQKGCGMNCFFCAGCRRVQERIFNRPHLVIRRPEEVRKDVLAAMKYASNLKFDFDVADKNLLAYCKKIWDGIDLSSHFCTITNLLPPTPELIEYVNKTFKYVYWNLDIASLSERHRKQLVSLGLIKPQPGDAEIIAFLDECQKYDNTEFIINMIAGLPYFNREDIDRSRTMLSYIMDNYTCFSELFWARLHAQPGAPVVEDAEKYNMHSYARTFEHYLKYSRMNFDRGTDYPTVEYSHYPYIYYNDDQFNSEISKHYSETNSAIATYKENKRRVSQAAGSLSYLELDKRADRLAGFLKEKGTAPGSIVGVMMNRSPDLVTGILAILKAGGAYLPVDPAYPAARRKFMLEDSGVKVLLTENHFIRGDKEFFRGLSLEHVLAVDDEGVYSSDCCSSPGPAAKPEDLLYVIYTSGSTGKPKGVMIPHVNFINLVEYHRSVFGEGPGARMSQVAGLSFDAMAFEVWPCLTSGASLYIADDNTRIDPAAMKEWLIENEITISFQPTMMAEYLLRLEWPEQGTALQALRAAGDRLTAYPGRRYPFRFYNLYGPTEDTVWTTWREVGVNDNNGNAPDIGKPTGNKRVYIFGPDLSLQPVGAAGELCISGDGLARGYLNNPGLTAEKFIANPHEKNGMMYRTGDLARWLPGGCIDFLGRIDHQVKLRGIRVELEEIEKHLQKHREVKDVVVTVREDKEGDKYLCAYIVPDSPGSAAEDQSGVSRLREYLSEELPDHMIPTYFTALERLPLTPNGKIDTRALPEPKAGEGEANYTAARNALEEKLVEIWSEILGLEKEIIGIDGKFFELGGHSLKATMMVAEIHKKLNVKIPLEDVFKIPTIRGLAKLIGGTPQDEYVSLENVEEREYYPLSSAQKRLYIIRQLDPGGIGYNIPTFIPMEEKVDVDKFKRVFKKLLDRHESLRTSCRMVGEEPVQQVNKTVELDFRYYEAGEEEAKRIAQDFVQPFDLSTAPLMRVGFMRLKEGKQVLMVDVHHIVADGSSLEILVKEFSLLHRGEELPPPRLRYKDFVAWRNGESRKEVLRSQEEYWLEVFKEEVPVLNLPLDYPGPQRKSFEGSFIEFEIAKEETEKLKGLAKQIEATLYIVMLSVFNIFLSKLGGQEDIVIGTPLEGRNHADLRSVIGMFVNTLALRNYPRAGKTFREFLKEVKERTVKAFENQDYQFEDLVEKLRIKREPDRNPLFDILFSFQTPEEEAAGDVGPIDYGFKIVQFDLILTGVEKRETLSFVLEYRTALFKRETIERFAKYFKDVAAAVLENNDVCLKDITILQSLSTAGKKAPGMEFNF